MWQKIQATKKKTKQNGMWCGDKTWEGRRLLLVSFVEPQVGGVGERHIIRLYRCADLSPKKSKPQTFIP